MDRLIASRLSETGVQAKLPERKRDQRQIPRRLSEKSATP
jgi:hypothetical protein